MKKITPPLWGLLFLIFPFFLQAQSLDNLTLTDAISLGLDQNKNIQSRLLDERNSANDRKEALSPAYPQIKGTATFQHNILQPVNFVPATAFGGPEGVYNQLPQGLKNNSQVAVEATQLIYNQSLFDGLKAIKVSSELTKVQTQKEKQDLSYQITSVYYGAYILNQQIEIVKSNVQTIEKTAKISELNYNNGLIRKLDYERILVNKGNLETQLKSLQLAYHQQLNTLLFLMNMPLETPITLAKELETLPEYSLQMEDYTSKRFDFQLLKKQQELNQMQYQVTRAGYFPILQAFLNYNFNWVNPQFSNLYTSNLNYPGMTYGLRLSIPIFDGMDKAAKMNRTKIKQQQLTLQEELLTENIKLQTLNALEKWQVNKEVVKNQKINMELAEKIYQQSSKEYEQGLASLNDLLQSETSVRDAQSKYMDAMSNLLVAIVEWKKATGN